jgi:hypothetical protein
MGDRLPSWWAYPEHCDHGHLWGPGKVMVSWNPYDCPGPANQCTRGDFRDHAGESEGCMVYADLDPDQPCYAAMATAAARHAGLAPAGGAETDLREYQSRRDSRARAEQDRRDRETLDAARRLNWLGDSLPDPEAGQ